MKVSDLAAELEVPASTVLAQCQRFGIDASWAGAELSGADVVVLRSELANSEAIDLTPADGAASPADASALSPTIDVPEGAASDPIGAAGPAATPAPDAALPPTAVGSMPELIDAVTPPPEPDPAPASDPGTSGFIRTAQGERPTTSGSDRDRVVHKPKYDRTIHSCLIALLVAVAAVVGSNFVDLAILVVLLWVIAAVSLVVAVVDALRGRRRAVMHPDRFRGTAVATIVLVLAAAGIVGITASVLAVTAEDPDDVPGGLADLSSVQVARWGYQRAMRLSDEGWKQPAREPDTCWRAKPDRDPRDVERVEAVKINAMVSCSYKHTLEVIDVFAYNRDADAPYPGPDGFSYAGQVACGEPFAKIQAKAPKATLKIEYPTAGGWRDADHDVACVVITPERTGRLGA